MNLIENLGGYESAKSKARDNGSFHSERLKKALLEYRRQHNIFEVGDKVVVKAHPFWPEDYVILTVEQEHIGKWYMSAWRHATDAEIKAGKRLEVESEN
ncbi:hypothetical protein [Acinetobacter sp. P1332]|uniref:hypothetical protein n=1 Tax=Acinetobacter sp. P1332 TaxID=3366266 RepID=UPI003757E072